MKLDKPIVFFDLETTGISIAEDRVVDIAMVKRLPSGEEEFFESLVDPGVPIPPEASAIHNITDDMVRGAPSFTDLSPKLLGFFADCDLGGFGIVKFDVPVLSAEFRRAGFRWVIDGRRIIDALTIFHRMEPRNLGAALKFYCGKPLDGAHRASADTRAAEAVFWAQLERYPGLPKDIEGLSAYCGHREFRGVDPECKFVWRNGKASFNFGKFRMVALEDVARREPSYLEWLSRDKASPELARICREALQGRFPDKPAA